MSDPFTIATKHWHRPHDSRSSAMYAHALQLHEGTAWPVFRPRPIDDQVKLTSYGRSSGFCVDPIEKKPLNHFCQGSAIAVFRHRRVRTWRKSQN